MKIVFFVAVSGALGALGRWGISSAAGRFFGEGFPYGTLIVNVAGCFLLGLIMHISLTTDLIREDIRMALTIGFLGALTTFSTFGYETVRLMQDGSMFQAVGNILLNVIVGLVAVISGIAVGRLIAGGS